MLTYDNFNLQQHNTFGITARCKHFVEYSNTEELRDLLPSLVANNEPWMQIGGGSNLLFTADYPGTILHSAIKGIEEKAHGDEDVLVTAGAGIRWDDFVAWTLRHGFYGLENLSYIPGEVGASAVQNIGAYGSEAADHIERVTTIDSTDGSTKTFHREECHYAYRHSIFKEEAVRGRYIITHVTYRLHRTFRPVLVYAGLRNELERRSVRTDELTADQLRRIIIEVRRAKLPEPSEIGSAGSFFMNPIVPQETFENLQTLYPNMPHYPAPTGVKLSAGWLIDQCGWKGKRLGPAGVYALQALVLVNHGGATGADIVRLSETIQHDVFNKFGIQLRPEAIFI